ncbi:Uncharacterized protein OBRU01_02685 [Operophtera brumata]|uniref:Luciferin 4-monooxygenase n=1 Tax=Operophtera brumata TaxID=104452 RepID=A0A0L7LS68_OPEBR|nr:Uncharacterized protein OBRU01_02685 [Operophtera brumata]
MPTSGTTGFPKCAAVPYKVYTIAGPYFCARFTKYPSPISSAFIAAPLQWITALVHYMVSPFVKYTKIQSSQPMTEEHARNVINKYRLVNQNTQEDINVPNVIGELWIKSPGMFKEYYNDPEATVEAFAEDGWLKTGDLFYRDEEWNYYFVERIKQMLKYDNGYNFQVSPVEVESVISKHPEVSDVAVTGIPDKEHGDLLVACVVPRPGCTPNSLADSKQLRGGVVILKALPTTATTKINRRKLRDMALLVHNIKVDLLTLRERLGVIMPGYKHYHDTAHWNMADITSRMIAKSGIPSDRFHLGKIILQSLKDSPDNVAQIEGSTGESETNSSVLRRSIQCAIGELVDTFSVNKPKIVFCQSEKVEDVRKSLKELTLEAKVITFDKGDGDIDFSDLLEKGRDEKEIESFCPTNFDPAETIAILIATSGTTGLPKSAAATHKNFAFTRIQTLQTVTQEHAYELINKYRPTFMIISPTMMTTFMKPGDRDKCDFTCFELIMLGGSAVFINLIEELQGYYKNPEATKETFAEGGWFKTGDLFYRDESWSFYFVERTKLLLNQESAFIQLRLMLKTLITFQISPVELEAVIRQHPDVLDVAVTGIPDPECGELPVACVVPVPGREPSAQEIKDLVKGYKHYHDTVHWNMADITSRIIAESGIPCDRFHLGKIILQSLKDSPDNVAQIEGTTGESETNSSVLKRSIQCAVGLKKLELKQGDVMILMAPNHLDLTVPFYAALYLGIAIAPIDRFLGISELVDTFTITEPKIIFCQSEKVEDVRKALKELALEAKIITFDKAQQISTQLKRFQFSYPQVGLLDCQSQLPLHIRTSLLRDLISGKREVCDFTCFELIMLGGSAVYSNLFEELGLVDIDTERDINEPNINGELWLKGPGLFKGYYKNPEATKETFAEGGWFKTGDLFYRDESWSFYFVERTKLLLKYRNHQISPVELEAVIRQHPGVLDVAVTGIPDPECGELPVACVVPAPGREPSAQEIKDLVKELLADSKQLRGGVIFLKQLPVTASTKVHRRKIKEIALNTKRE